jgi:hypothetical protein
MTESKNPYGPRPGGGISLPDYYRPWAAIKNRNMYLPGTEELPENEMRITFLGSAPWPPNRLQKGTSILVELGNGTMQPRRFFFDLGNGSIGHALAVQVPAALINDIFISHLHADHYADLPYMYPFRAFSGGFQALRVYGPSGATPELGIKEMVKNMRAMNRWHEENFNSCPMGDGLEIEVHEFDWKERNGICYDQDGVKVRHWPRSHVKDGASAYRLDWEDAGLSFVWTGDGRPDELSAEYGVGLTSSCRRAPSTPRGSRGSNSVLLPISGSTRWTFTTLRITPPVISSSRPNLVWPLFATSNGATTN